MKKLTLALAIGASLVGCSKPGHEYIGIWHSSSDGLGNVTIKSSGDSYAVTNDGSISTTQTCGIAQYQNGNLVCGTGLTFSYDKDNNTVLINSAAGIVTLTYVK